MCKQGCDYAAATPEGKAMIAAAATGSTAAGVIITVLVLIAIAGLALYYVRRRNAANKANNNNRGGAAAAVSPHASSEADLPAVELSVDPRHTSTQSIGFDGTWDPKQQQQPAALC
jgi:hypothetical protein